MFIKEKASGAGLGSGPITRLNPLARGDSYKDSHYLQYPPGTEYISSYIEARGGQYKSTVFFGLQMFLQQYMTEKVTHADIDEARDFAKKHGTSFNEEGWRYIVDRYDGVLPVRIDAVPEGMTLSTKNALVQIVNTDPKCAWLTSYLETRLLRAIWYPTTVATVSATFKAIAKEFLDETSDNAEACLPFMLQDFGARGVAASEAAAIGGAAHLVNFKGSDTKEGVCYANHFYHEEMSGYSIDAAEHSTITSWGKEREFAAYDNMLDQFLKPGKMVAIVSDSYDLWNAVDNYFCREDIVNRIKNSGGRVVVRPDSGNPVEVAPAVVERLMSTYGYTVNSKGYKVLPSCIRVIQGDGVNHESVRAILAELKKRKISAENIVFGAGGELLQKVNRDTQKWAQKASAISFVQEDEACEFHDRVWMDVYKDPATDPGKGSRRGRFAVVADGDDYKTIRIEELAEGQQNFLQTVWENGEAKVDWTLAEVRARAEEGGWRVKYIAPIVTKAQALAKEIFGLMGDLSEQELEALRDGLRQQRPTIKTELVT